MTRLLFNSRFIGLLLAASLPFCCCSLGLCGAAAANDGAPSCGCCVEVEPCSNDESTPAQPPENCSCCLKAPATTSSPTLPTFAPIAHPAVVTSSVRAIYPAVVLHRTTGCFPPGDDPGITPRAYHQFISLQV